MYYISILILKLNSFTDILLEQILDIKLCL